MGCYFSGRLAENGFRVQIVDVDQARLEAMRLEGITLHDDLGTRAVAISGGLATEVAGEVDVLIVFTKGQYTAAAVQSVRHLISPNTIVLTLQNGLGNAETIAAVQTPAHVLIGVTDVPADLEGPTTVSSHGKGHIWLGQYETSDNDDVARVAACLQAGGFDAVVDNNVRVPIWEKVAFNAALNALCTVTMVPVGGLAGEVGLRLIARVTDEVAAVAKALDVPVDLPRILAKIDFALNNHQGHKPSMLQDRLANRRTEIDFINGAVSRLGRDAGIPTPTNDVLVDLIRVIEG